MQHADHFTRVLNDRESFKRDKFSESKSDLNSEVIEENIENSEQNSTKNLEENSSDELKIQKNPKTQIDVI